MRARYIHDRSRNMRFSRSPRQGYRRSVSVFRKETSWSAWLAGGLSDGLHDFFQFDAGGQPISHTKHIQRDVRLAEGQRWSDIGGVVSATKKDGCVEKVSSVLKKKES